MTDVGPVSDMCNFFAVRLATRHITQFYDQFLVSAGLRTTQFWILAKLGREGSLTITRLAQELFLDRTTLSRTIVPLQRNGLVIAASETSDRRRRELCLSAAGTNRLLTATQMWLQAQARFEQVFERAHAVELRALLHAVVLTELDVSSAVGSGRTP